MRSLGRATGTSREQKETRAESNMGAKLHRALDAIRSLDWIQEEASEKRLDTTRTGDFFF